MNKNVKKRIRNIQFAIAAKSTILNIKTDTLSVKEIIELYSKYLQEQYIEFKKEIKPLEDKILKRLYGNLQMQYSTSFFSNQVYIYLVENCSKLTVTVNLSPFKYGLGDKSHVKCINPPYLLYEEPFVSLRDDFIKLAEQYRDFYKEIEKINLIQINSKRYNESLIIDLNMHPEDHNYIDIVITTYKNNELKFITSTYDYEGIYKEDSFKIHNYKNNCYYDEYIKEEIATYINTNILPLIRTPINSLPNALLKYIGDVEKIKKKIYH